MRTARAAAAKSYDFNGDGHRDLAIGAQSTTVGSATGTPGSGEEDDAFGETLASATLNKGGYADLVVGNPTEHVGTTEYRGTVTIVWGSGSGLSGGTDLTPKSGANGSNAHLGSDLATGGLDGDGSPDLHPS
ncbi:hypothetical protein [Streptomyces sp. NPDC050564]|uniref:hypothetical protein n=1 Tax=Streptomyces sp. NPDC050564 TaxID=3365631 RepID=UPI0037903896